MEQTQYDERTLRHLAMDLALRNGQNQDRKDLLGLAKEIYKFLSTEKK